MSNIIFREIPRINEAQKFNDRKMLIKAGIHKSGINYIK